MTDHQKQMYDDLRWGRNEVFTKRTDLVQKYSETGGVVAVCRGQIVADAVDVVELEKHVNNAGHRLTDVALVEIASSDFP